MEIVKNIESPVVQPDEELYEALYDEAFPVIASIVSRRGGSRHDAEDIFQDALIALLDMQERVRIQDRTRYVVGIAKHLWIRRARTNSRFLKLDDYEQSLSLADEVIDEPRLSSLLRFLQRTGSKCMDLLGDFYFAGLSIAEITARHGFGNPHSASVQKHKCIEKVKNIVRKKNISYGDFTG